jgi:hypothetical protein
MLLARVAGAGSAGASGARNVLRSSARHHLFVIGVATKVSVSPVM